MKKQTEDILIAFALHEKLSFPKVKQIYKNSTPTEREEALKEMKKVILRPIPDYFSKNGTLQFDIKDQNKKDE